ncbi:MAG: DNA polymerase/3'-5' exonuclease PolX [Ferruginibacter sp.]|nr:DNA polymerase/3'-5' exonuclease PolX [Cytophagales bacterium]
MENSAIIQLFKLTVNLLELHDENPFRVKSYQNAIFSLEKTDATLADLSSSELEKLDGLGKSLAAKIDEINRRGTFAELDDLLIKTPAGVIEMFDIKGIGPKKIRVIWKALGIDNPQDLLQACEEDQVAKLKGFGEKTQASIRQSLLYHQANADKLHFARAEAIAAALKGYLLEKFERVSESGQVRRKLEVVDCIQLVVGWDAPTEVTRWLNAHPLLRQNGKESSPFVWRGRYEGLSIAVEVFLAPLPQFTSRLFLHSGTPSHLAHRGEAAQPTLLKTALSGAFESEEAIYQRAGLPYIAPELREGLFEFEWVKTHAAGDLVTLSDLKGILHNHSTYSDGKHSLEEMALYCRELGFEYLGISDHSQSAYYANGLPEERVRQQHREVDALNQRLAPFRVFKGIESDILNDGLLDYPDEVLASFDFVVASIHSNLKMDERRATQRLIRAIENPYTTILGHPTGRLLLRREAYPIDHPAVIDACAEHGVVIEVNANPWRLDLDWRWLPYALEKGVRISINPDAHEKSGYHDMQYGVAVARKGGLTRPMTFNALSLAEVERFFSARKLR